MGRIATLQLWCCLALLGLCGCGDEQQQPPQAVAGTQVLMDFARGDGFYAAPFPSDDLLGADGSVALAAFPNPKQVDLVQRALALLKGARGFALSGGVFMQLTGALAPARLPGLSATTRADAPLFLAAVDGAASGALIRTPLEARFVADSGLYGAPNLLSLLPLQGVPLRPRTRYAAVVLRRLGDAQGHALGRSLSMAQLAAGVRPPGLSAAAFARYRDALATLEAAGVRADSIAGMAVFTTGAPTEQLATLRAAVLARPLPVPDGPFVRTDLLADYCVYRSTIQLPVYQGGKAPYLSGGGGWVVDASGAPVLQRLARSNMVLTIPRKAMPAAGYPTVAFIRTGGGGERPLVDRGPVTKAGGTPAVKGAGPALHFARAGFAALSVDGPHGGLRNVTKGDEQYLMFNISNAAALRDNIRQSALEYILLAHVLQKLTLPVADCPGAGSGATPARFDTQRLALMGHSMGATIAPLVLAHEPRYRAVILSGAGASWIENVIHKRKPLQVRPIADLLVGYLAQQLTTHDPVLSLVQWATEPADPQVYARLVGPAPADGQQPRHVLMLQGIVDNYILPRIANALSLPLGLDLAGVTLDSGVKGLEGQTPLATVLPLVGRGTISLPATGNVTSSGGVRTTAVVLQHREDGIQDGHEVVFQRDLPKHQYRCFLESFARGLPVVPASTSGACK